tara:strand:+ start:30 stop:149 length:120 start_codon:yes stop_codon:yes gene_type:complete
VVDLVEMIAEQVVTVVLVVALQMVPPVAVELLVKVTMVA